MWVAFRIIFVVCRKTANVSPPEEACSSYPPTLTTRVEHFASQLIEDSLVSFEVRSGMGYFLVLYSCMDVK